MKARWRNTANFTSTQGKQRVLRSNETLKNSQDTDGHIKIKKRYGGLLKYICQHPA